MCEPDPALDSERRSAKATKEDWPSWLDTHRYVFGGVVLCALLGLYVALVVASGARSLTPLEQVALGFIGPIVSAAVGVLLSVPLVRRRARIGSQLRRAYGICLALKSVQRDIRMAAERMQRRSSLDHEATEELWGEVIFNIQTALRVPIREAQRMFEDWSELDRQERDRIQQEEDQREREIQGLHAQLEAARSVDRDLEGIESRFGRLADKLEHRIQELQDSGPSTFLSYVPGRARALVDRGDYQEAVQVYNKIIATHPTTHTNYIGRARARYLAQDVDGALEDLKHADAMCPDDPAIGQLREQITTGQVPTARLRATAQEECLAGNQSLSLGNPEEALRHYKAAEELGWNVVFSSFNAAMAHCLAGRIPEAVQVLEKYHPDEDSYVAANTLALRAVCAGLENSDNDVILNELTDQLGRIGRYHYARSPLRWLESGLRRRYPDRYGAVVGVFNALRAAATEDGSVH